MTDTLDPSKEIEKPKPGLPEATSSLVDNDNLVLVSLADLKRFRSRFESYDVKMTAPQFLDALIEDIEEDKARQAEEAQAAMEKFNPVKPIGNV